MIIIDDQPPVNPKAEALKALILKLLPEASRRVKYRVFKLKRGWENCPYNELHWISNWLGTVIGLCEQVDEIKDRHTPEVWERYRKYGIKGLTEQVELNKRTQNLQMFLNTNKPPYLQKAMPSKTAKEIVLGPDKAEN